MGVIVAIFFLGEKQAAIKENLDNEGIGFENILANEALDVVGGI